LRWFYRDAVGEAESTDALSWTRASIKFLHHSTGRLVWNAGVANWFTKYNSTNSMNYQISESWYPDGNENYPYDYWNIWVNDGASQYGNTTDTLETLTKTYNVIIWKHCFPGSLIDADSGDANVASPAKQIQNYKLQYDTKELWNKKIKCRIKK
jgi:hypothetical protein